ncbi:hypothetical protein QFC19_007990 [Naganishia cerealis]|uniref:Uncharacterized protein n=1 Tax=Naganishia cerealis TaxID=610337 RepID=A0ACC2V688_9TREE|nr:hypothetical protein QFC19_007990 [Naganishia cerealis]
MSDDKKPITAFKELLDIPEQKQNLPGLEGKMDPLARHTEIEAWDDEGNPFLQEVSTWSSEAGLGEALGDAAVSIVPHGTNPEDSFQATVGQPRFKVSSDAAGYKIEELHEGCIGRLRLVYKGSGKLKGKAAIITGGDSGIGRAVAFFFVREGADVTITYLPQEKEDAEKVKQQIEKEEGGKCHIVECDLMKHEDCERVVKEHMAKYGKMSILINNASKQIVCENIADIDLKNVESTFQSNIIAMIAMAKYAVPHMKRGSTIVNSTSVTAFKGSS